MLVAICFVTWHVLEWRPCFEMGRVMNLVGADRLWLRFLSLIRPGLVLFRDVCLSHSLSHIASKYEHVTNM